MPAALAGIVETDGITALYRFKSNCHLTIRITCAPILLFAGVFSMASAFREPKRPEGTRRSRAFERGAQLLLLGRVVLNGVSDSFAETLGRDGCSGNAVDFAVSCDGCCRQRLQCLCADAGRFMVFNHTDGSNALALKLHAQDDCAADPAAAARHFAGLSC